MNRLSLSLAAGAALLATAVPAKYRPVNSPQRMRLAPLARMAGL